MITQVIVNMDSTLKARAMKKAKKAGLPFSYVINHAVRAYVEDKFGIEFVQKFNAKTDREIRQALKDIKEGKNLSPVFHSVDEARKYLDN